MNKLTVKIYIYQCPKCDFIGWTQKEAYKHHLETGH